LLDRNRFARLEVRKVLFDPVTRFQSAFLLEKQDGDGGEPLRYGSNQEFPCCAVWKLQLDTGLSVRPDDLPNANPSETVAVKKSDRVVTGDSSSASSYYTGSV